MVAWLQDNPALRGTGSRRVWRPDLYHGATSLLQGCQDSADDELVPEVCMPTV